MTANGNKKNIITTIISSTSRVKKTTMSASITQNFINIPIPIEKPTKPSLYSFFHGLKKVFIKSDKDTNCKKYLFKERKNFITEIGTSMNQKRKKAIGNCI